MRKDWGGNETETRNTENKEMWKKVAAEVRARDKRNDVCACPQQREDGDRELCDVILAEKTALIWSDIIKQLYLNSVL